MLGLGLGRHGGFFTGINFECTLNNQAISKIKLGFRAYDRTISFCKPFFFLINSGETKHSPKNYAIISYAQNFVILIL